MKWLLLLILTACAAIPTAPVMRVVQADPAPGYVGVLFDLLSPRCTAVLIDEQTVVTAAHCADAFGSTYVMFQPGVLIRVELEPHPEFTPYGGRYDIALGQLAADPGVEPIPIRREPITHDMWNTDIVLAGCAGKPEIRWDDSHWLFGKIEGTDLLLWADPQHWLQPGDSGGPLIIDGQLAGINVIGVRETDPGMEWRTGMSTSIPDNLEFIDEFIARAYPGRLPQLPVPGVEEPAAP